MDFMSNKSLCQSCLRDHSFIKRVDRIYRPHRYHCGNGQYKRQWHRYRNKNKDLWRPWVEKEDDVTENQKSLHNIPHFASFGVCGTPLQSPPQFQHPVKLVWPKKPYDYMYAEGARLLRDFPVQATLEFAADSDIESDGDDDDDDDGKEDGVTFNKGRRQSTNQDDSNEQHTEAQSWIRLIPSTCSR